MKLLPKIIASLIKHCATNRNISFINHLQGLGNSQHPSQVFTINIIVFDKSEGDQEVWAILAIITEAENFETIRLVFFITSQPKTPISLDFKKMVGIQHQDLLLHNIPKQMVEGDILVFLTGQMKKDYDLSKGWQYHSMAGPWFVYIRCNSMSIHWWSWQTGLRRASKLSSSRYN